MKKLFLLLCLSTFIVACNQKTEQSTDNNPMSGYIKGDDIYTQGVHKFMKAYTLITILKMQKEIFAENAVFAVNDAKMSIDDMMSGFAVGHQFFDNISHSNVDTATMYYNDGKIYHKCLV